MREVKYQAWERKERVMFQVARFDFADYSVYRHLFGEGIPAEQCDLREFTGLHDRYDNELYEGDIVETHRHLLKRYVVRFIDGCFVFATHYEGMCSYKPISVFFEGDYVIIKLGNIYETPELLEGADK